MNLVKWLKDKWALRTDPDAALSIFKKALHKLDTVEKRLLNEERKWDQKVFDSFATEAVAQEQFDKGIERIKQAKQQLADTELEARSKYVAKMDAAVHKQDRVAEHRRKLQSIIG